LRIIGESGSCNGNETELDWVKNPQAVTDSVYICTGCTAPLLEGVNLQGAVLRNSNFPEADYTSENMSNIKIEYANISSSNFTNVNFTGADMRNVIFNSSTDADGANFSDADVASLTAVTWDNTVCPDGTNSDNNSNTCVGHLTP
jgi:hypothetical protein